MKRSQSYIGEFDLWKLIAAIVIVIHHSSYLPVQVEHTYLQGGSILVELFFLISGFFLAKSALREGPSTSGEELGKETWRFLRKKAGAIYPYLLFAVAVGVIVKTLLNGQNFLQLIKNGIRTLVEFLFLRSAGWGKELFAPQDWYLSAMLLAMLILYPCIRKWGRGFVRIVCPLIAAFLLGYLYQKFGHFRAPDTFVTFFNKGFLRGLAEISLGCFCYEAAQWVRQFSLTRFAKLLCALVEYGSLLAIIAYANTESCWDMDCESVILMAVAVIIMGSQASILSQFWDRSGICPILGKFSLLLYLNHMYWLWLFKMAGLQMAYVPMLALYAACSCASSLVCWGVVDFLRKRSGQFKALFVKG